MKHPILVDSYDLHVHTGPDVVERKCSDTQLAHRLVEAGMRGCVIKNHFFETAARAKMLREQFPELEVVGGIVLNRSVGGLNPYAVEKMAQMDGKYVWFPTLDALHFQKFHHRNDQNADLSEFLPVCDENQSLLPNAKAVLELAAKYNLIIGTGHIAPEEGMAVLQEAAKIGVRKMVVTHADNPADCYTIEQQKEAVRLGAVIEHSFFTTYFDRTPIEEIVRQIRAVGCENVILTTDFGQVNSPYSDEGMLAYAELLIRHGLTEQEVRQMICDNPKKLLQ